MNVTTTVGTSLPAPGVVGELVTINGRQLNSNDLRLFSIYGVSNQSKESLSSKFKIAGGRYRSKPRKKEPSNNLMGGTEGDGQVLETEEAITNSRQVVGIVGKAGQGKSRSG